MTVSDTTDTRPRRISTVAGWVLFSIALAVAVQGAFILVDDRVLGLTVVAVGLQVALLVWFALRRELPVGWPALWVFPAMLFAWALHFLINDDLQIGLPNLVFAILAALALLAARSELSYGPSEVSA